MFLWRDDLPPRPGRHGVLRAFTDRDGGASRCGLGDYGASADLDGGLNLGGRTDDPADIEANRRTVAAGVGVPREHLVFMRQVHGRDVVVVDGPWPGTPPTADALVTTNPDLVLATLAADCVPMILLGCAPAAESDDAPLPETPSEPMISGRSHPSSEPNSEPIGAPIVVAVAHAGREGMRAGVATAVVEAMRDLGARDVHAVVGPSICPRCYEVPAAMADDAGRAEPVSRAVSWTGTPAIDVAAGVVAQLRRAGAGVRWLPGCTREEPRLYSHRRCAPTGRFAGLTRLLPAAPGRPS